MFVINTLTVMTKRSNLDSRHIGAKFEKGISSVVCTPSLRTYPVDGRRSLYHMR